MKNKAKIGDDVICIENGQSLSKGELYYKNNIYKLTHVFNDKERPTYGLEGFTNICLQSHFKLHTEVNIVESIEIW